MKKLTSGGYFFETTFNNKPLHQCNKGRGNVSYHVELSHILAAIWAKIPLDTWDELSKDVRLDIISAYEETRDLEAAQAEHERIRHKLAMASAKARRN